MLISILCGYFPNAASQASFRDGVNPFKNVITGSGLARLWFGQTNSPAAVSLRCEPACRPFAERSGSQAALAQKS